MSRPLATRLRLFAFPAASSRTLNHAFPELKTRPCLLCQHRRRFNRNVRTLHGSRILASSMPSAGSAPNPSRAPSEETGSPISDTPDITNHYTVFPKTIPKGPPPAGPFSIPLSTLRREFFDIQALVHPDKFPSGPQKQRAEALSSRINEAYRTLADPLSRAQYLLAYLHNVDVNAEDGAQTHPHDKETLMQVLEVQEAIEEAEDETLIAELRTENEQRIDECVDTLGKALEREDVETARAECVKLRFWYNIRDCLREWEPGKEVRVVH